MTTTTEYGKQNIFAKEPPIQIMNENEQNFLMEQAERTNGQLAMLGFVAALGCPLYTSPSPRDRTRSRMPSSA